MRGRLLIEEYAWLLDYDDPEDHTEHAQTGIDALNDMLHYLDFLGDDGATLDVALKLNQIETLARKGD